MNFKDWSAVLGTWVSIAGALLGGFLALQAYQQDVEVRKAEVAKQADARVVQTFALFEQFQGSEMMRIRNRLTPLIQASDTNAVQGQQDLFSFVDFFDAVQICIDRDLCDEALADRLFGPYARGTLPAVRHLLYETRSLECASGTGSKEPYGFGLEVLATGTPPSSDCSTYPLKPRSEAR
jgi:hypothetical protein